MKPVLDAPDAYYIVVDTPSEDPETRALKQGETFAVFDAFGDVTSAGGQLGLYHAGTRHLSVFQLRLARHRPFLLGSSPGASSHILTVDLTNPDIRDEAHVAWPRGTLHVRRETFLWDATCFVLVTVTNHGLAPVAFPLELTFDADFRDVFEVRGTVRPTRGHLLPVRPTPEGLVFGYDGLDGVRRSTTIQIDPRPTVGDDGRCRLDVAVQPGERRELFVAISCGRSKETFTLAAHSFDEALGRAREEIDEVRAPLGVVATSSDLFDEWLERSTADIAMMVTRTPYGPYPYAGIPWFSTMFGRDGILTALAVLWADPSLARGVLFALAATQATTIDAGRDAEPGKILHEARDGEMAALGEIPFGRYYGSVDSTPLFVLLAGRYYERTGDMHTMERLWPHVDAALSWIDKFGDIDGDGFVEYARATERGLVNQGWKDSHDAIFHADGTLADGPIALSEVQGYVFAAKRHAAEIAAALGNGPRASRLELEAERLHAEFERAFWCDDIGVYALALDGRKQPCRVVSSNSAQCLMSGIAVPDRGERVADTVMQPDMFSGWGVRTIRDGEPRFNPMAYHNGSIWPHDTALAALGLSRYGRKDDVVRLADGMFEAAQHFNLRRLPELFCGFTRRHGEPPTQYPTACAPQAWASAAVFQIVQALLGLEVDGRRKCVLFRQPRLPACLEWLRLTRLAVGSAELDVLCERRGNDVGISVLRRSGDVRLITEK